jgi:spore maturation protein CgeB
LLPISTAVGEAYTKAIAAAKVALVFLSKRNRDTYTRRCFEIPAIGTLMLTPRTPDLLSMYRDGEEAAFFSSAAEAVEQVRRFIDDDALRLKVAAAGRVRCVRDGHDVVSRARQFLRDLALSDVT